MPTEILHCRESLMRLNSIPYAETDRIQEGIDAHEKSVSISSISKSTSWIPVLFHRRWVIASVRGHLRELRRAKRCVQKSDHAGYTKNINLASLWLGQAEKLIEMCHLFLNIKNEDIQKYTITPEKIEKGDIVLSYKTRTFLKKNPISRFVEFASNSQITHVMCACHEKNQTPKILVSGDDTNGLGIVGPTPKIGEVFIILSPKDTEHRNNTYHAIDAWRTKAENRDTTQIGSSSDTLILSELKFTVACIIGVFVVIMIFLGRPLTLRSPVTRARGVFCSELIDTIYKEGGIIVSPRSTHDAVVGPIEFLYSPIFNFKGIIAREDDLLCLQDEVRQMSNAQTSYRHPDHSNYVHT